MIATVVAGLHFRGDGGTVAIEALLVPQENPRPSKATTHHRSFGVRTGGNLPAIIAGSSNSHFSNWRLSINRRSFDVDPAGTFHAAAAGRAAGHLRPVPLPFPSIPPPSILPFHSLAPLIPFPWSPARPPPPRHPLRHAPSGHPARQHWLMDRQVLLQAGWDTSGIHQVGLLPRLGLGIVDCETLRTSLRPSF